MAPRPSHRHPWYNERGQSSFNFLRSQEGETVQDNQTYRLGGAYLLTLLMAVFSTIETQKPQECEEATAATRPPPGHSHYHHIERVNKQSVWSAENITSIQDGLAFLKLHLLLLRINLWGPLYLYGDKNILNHLPGCTNLWRSPY